MKFIGLKEIVLDEPARNVWINVEKITYVVAAVGDRTSILTDDTTEFLIDEPVANVVARLNARW